MFHAYHDFACMPVYLYPMNIKTAKPIEPNFLWQLYNMTPGKEYFLLKMTNFAREKLAPCIIFSNANMYTK